MKHDVIAMSLIRFTMLCAATGALQPVQVAQPHGVPPGGGRDFQHAQSARGA